MQMASILAMPALSRAFLYALKETLTKIPGYLDRDIEPYSSASQNTGDFPASKLKQLQLGRQIDSVNALHATHRHAAVKGRAAIYDLRNRLCTWVKPIRPPRYPISVGRIAATDEDSAIMHRRVKIDRSLAQADEIISQ
ncbi:hypothetical protein [Paraburkholderia unamae]|uniref:hypothetical protein n=1 Tax=Paraburkholderia unamae TaxID=219649 RepID=UPI0011BE69B7|nr:hypothetical protein [Paraburkholderia unamae]